MIIGIDPGINGAIAFISKNGETLLLDMPTCNQEWSAIKTRRTKVGVIKKDKKGNNLTYFPQRVNTLKLSELFYDCNEEEKIEKITIEVVHSMPTDGVKTAFSFGCSFASVLTVASNVCRNINYVYPAVWKTKFGLINLPKDASRQLALKIHPELFTQLKRKKDVDRADAFFIALS